MIRNRSVNIGFRGGSKSSACERRNCWDNGSMDAKYHRSRERNQRNTCVCHHDIPPSWSGLSHFQNSALRILQKSNYSKNPTNPSIQPANCPQHSALMGGQFAAENDQVARKNPLFFHGFCDANCRKNELSFLTPKNSPFLALYSGIFHFFHVLYAKKIVDWIYDSSYRILSL